MKLHKTLVGVDPKKVVATFVNDRIVKVFFREGWEGKTYIPEMILWEESKK